MTREHSFWELHQVLRISIEQPVVKSVEILRAMRMELVLLHYITHQKKKWKLDHLI